MQAQELLETYDKGAVVIKQFYLQHMLESLNDENLPENFKDFVKEQGIDNDTVAVMLTASPRTFFDVFDTNSIFISVKYGIDGFTWHITQLPFSEIKDTTVYTFRKEAEVAAVEKAFEILNEQL
jgi:hypothetical protein